LRPGILPAPLPLKRFKHISPSRFTALGSCALREVWHASSERRLLPSFPQAALGSIAHRLLEEAGRGKLANGRPQLVASRWDVLVEDRQRAMRESWLDRLILPFSRSVRDYDVRRGNALHKAEEIAREAAEHREPRAAGAHGYGFELEVSSSDGTVSGRVDRVISAPGGPVLIDYKSGRFSDRDEGTGYDEVKESYRVQLKLYAALYQATFGRWPVVLEVVPISGKRTEVPYAPEEALSLLDQAAASLQETNVQIDRAASLPPYQHAESRLASPSPSTCRFCLLRPVCAAYREACGAVDSPDWPLDVWGRVRSIRMLGNGRINLRIGQQLSKGEELRVRGLDPSPVRHPVLGELQEGDTVSIFNLRRDGADLAYSEGRTTVIYKVSAADSAGDNPELAAQTEVASTRSLGE
jgi:PD-(D/E)XK nuclease superfamily